MEVVALQANGWVYAGMDECMQVWVGICRCGWVYTDMGGCMQVWVNSRGLQSSGRCVTIMDTN